MRKAIDQVIQWLVQHPSRVYGYLTTIVVQLTVLIPGLSANTDFRIVCAVLGVSATETIHAKVSPAPKKVPGGATDSRQPVPIDIPPIIGQ